MRITSRRPALARIAPAVLTLSIGAAALAQELPLTLPVQPDSMKFALIGDSGTGTSSQLRVAKQLIAARGKFPYSFVLMTGDNLYGSESPSDYERKFEIPYKPLLEAGVKFYASLGNHDEPNQRFYKHFNMNGQRFYTFKPTNASVRFFALDSNYVDKTQLDWLEKELTASGSDWKIAFFHHPIYSSGGRHGSDLTLREQLEPLFIKHGLNVVVAGHEHFYERLKPQNGIYYFVSGGAAKLREGDIGPTSKMTEKGFDTGYHFMLWEVAGDSLYFQVISDAGKTVDSGTIARAKK